MWNYCNVNQTPNSSWILYPNNHLQITRKLETQATSRGIQCIHRVWSSILKKENSRNEIRKSGNVRKHQISTAVSEIHHSKTIHVYLSISVYLFIVRIRCIRLAHIILWECILLESVPWWISNTLNVPGCCRSCSFPCPTLGIPSGCAIFYPEITDERFVCSQNFVKPYSYVARRVMSVIIQAGSHWSDCRYLSASARTTECLRR